MCIIHTKTIYNLMERRISMFEINLSPTVLLPLHPERAGVQKTIPNGGFPYKAFLPTKLQDVELTYTPDLVTLIGKTRAALATLVARYQMLSEGKQQEFRETMLETEVAASLKLAAADDSQADHDWLKRAIPYALAELEKLPLSHRLLTAVHDMVLHDLSHYQQNPGEFRRSPIWIGKKDATLTKGATFVPPAPEDMKDAFSALEHYMNEEQETEPLVRAALIHYQFEMIHPFLDGNGRVGRILALLVLKDAGLLPAPILPLSTALLNQSFSYYADLLGVENNGTYEVWVRYFIGCILYAAQTALLTLKDINF